MQVEGEGLVEPPNYYTTEHIFDINFHPHKDFIAYGNIDGEVKILSYDSSDTKVVFSKNLYKDSCRCLVFDPSGTTLASGGSDGSLVFLDESGKPKSRIDQAHEHPLYSLLYLSDSIFASGDDDGLIKIWDTRTQECVFDVNEQKEGTITQMVVHSSLHFLLAASTSGQLGVYDLRKGNNSKEKLYALSDQMEEEYHCLALLKDESKVTVGTSSGDIAVFNWDWFGDCKDRIVGHPEGVETMLKFNDQVIITGGEDGWIRVVGVYPHSINMFHKHAEDLDECFAVTGLGMSHDKNILASISHDCSINFYDLTEIADEVEEAEHGEKLELPQSEIYKPLKNEMSQKGGNKDKQQQRIMEKKKKLDFFGDM